MTPRKDKTLIHTDSRPGLTVHLYEGADLTELFADGIAQVMLGATVSKLVFTKVISVESGQDGSLTEHRETSVILGMPTLQLVEGLSIALKGIAANKDSILKAAGANVEKLGTAIDQLGKS